MEKTVKDELKIQFSNLINGVSQRNQGELMKELTAIRKYLDKYDGFGKNLIQEVGLFLSKNIIEKMNKTVSDILDNYDRYSIDDQLKVKSNLSELVTRYAPDRNFLDKLISVLRNS